MVAMPPKLEAYAIEIIMANAKFLLACSLSCILITTEITDMAIGYIIMVVAVLLNHMLMKPVDKINPNKILFPLEPVYETIFKAILLWSPHFSIPVQLKTHP